MNAGTVRAEDPQESSSKQLPHSDEEAHYTKIRKGLENLFPSSKNEDPQESSSKQLPHSDEEAHYTKIRKELENQFPPANQEITEELRKTSKPLGKPIKWRKITQLVTISCLIFGSLLIGSGSVFDHQLLLQLGSYLLLLVFCSLLVFSLYQAFSASNTKADNQENLNQKTPGWLAKGRLAGIFNVLNNPWRRALILLFAIGVVVAHLLLVHYFERYFVPPPGRVDPLTGIMYTVDFPMYVAPGNEETFFVTLTNPTTGTVKGVVITLQFSDNAQISLIDKDKENTTALVYGDLTPLHKTRKDVGFQVEKFIPVVVSVQLYLTTQDVSIHRVQSTYQFGIAPRYSKSALQKVLGLVSIVVSIVVVVLKETLQLPGS